MKTCGTKCCDFEPELAIELELGVRLLLLFLLQQPRHDVAGLNFRVSASVSLLRSPRRPLDCLMDFGEEAQRGSWKCSWLWQWR